MFNNLHRSTVNHLVRTRWLRYIKLSILVHPESYQNVSSLDRFDLYPPKKGLLKSIGPRQRFELCQRTGLGLPVVPALVLLASGHENA